MAHNAWFCVDALTWRVKARWLSGPWVLRASVALTAAASWGAGLGLLVIHDWEPASDRKFPAVALTRSNAWIAVSVVVAAAFVAFIGPGLTLRP